MTESAFCIHTYTRREALDDGVLIDVTEIAKASGFRIPVALTASAWAECIAVPFEPQEERERLKDVLWMLLFAIRSRARSGYVVRFQIWVQNHRCLGVPPLNNLKAVCGPNDDGTPCITVMQPEED